MTFTLYVIINFISGVAISYVEVESKERCISMMVDIADEAYDRYGNVRVICVEDKYVVGVKHK